MFGSQVMENFFLLQVTTMHSNEVEDIVSENDSK